MMVSSNRVTASAPNAAPFFVFLAAGLALAPVAGCGRSEAEPSGKGPDTGAGTAGEAPPLSVSLTAVREITIPRVLTLSGSLIGAERAQVAAGAAGKVLATFVERGSLVKKGSTLAKLDARMLNAQLEEATAQVESLRAQQSWATLDCERSQQMFTKGALAKADFDRSQNQCATAKWSLAGAEARRNQLTEALRDTDIRAPFTGMVVERNISAGEWVRVDSPVVSLVSNDSLRVELTVPEADVAGLQPAQTIEFRIPASGGRTTYQGKLKYIGPSVRQQSRDAIVEAVLDNPAHELRPGMFVTAEIALGQQVVPGVPRSAVLSQGAQHRLFVATAGRLEERLVQVGDSRGQDIPVLNGVKAGERVALNVTADLHDGLRVK